MVTRPLRTQEASPTHPSQPSQKWKSMTKQSAVSSADARRRRDAALKNAVAASDGRKDETETSQSLGNDSTRGASKGRPRQHCQYCRRHLRHQTVCLWTCLLCTTSYRRHRDKGGAHLGLISPSWPKLSKSVFCMDISIKHFYDLKNINSGSNI